MRLAGENTEIDCRNAGRKKRGNCNELKNMQFTGMVQRQACSKQAAANK